MLDDGAPVPAVPVGDEPAVPLPPAPEPAVPLPVPAICRPRRVPPFRNPAPEPPDPDRILHR